MSCVLMTLLLLELNMLNAFFISSSVGFMSPTLPVALAFLGFEAFFCVFALAGIVCGAWVCVSPAATSTLPCFRFSAFLVVLLSFCLLPASHTHVPGLSCASTL